MEVPQNFGAISANFPSIFTNTLVSKIAIGDWMKTYAEEEGILCRSRKMLISGFTLQNGTLITPLLLFYLQLGIFVAKIHRFVEYILKKFFHGFVQSAEDARRQGDEIPYWSVASETMKLLATSFCG